MVREHRGGVWERLAEDVTAADLSRELTDYEERRQRDRAKLEEMVRYCRTARCRTKMILEYFGEERPEDFACGHCDNEVGPAAHKKRDTESGARRETAPESTAFDFSGEEEDAPAFSIGEEVTHGTFGEGMVLGVTGDKAEVDFAGHGTRVVKIDFLRSVG
jgi:ATP-dependent DNA helicase RecQ